MSKKRKVNRTGGIRYVGESPNTDRPETPKEPPRKYNQIVTEKKTYCERHPKICKAGKVAGYGALVGAAIVGTGGTVLLEAPIEMGIEAGAEKYKKFKRDQEIRRTSEEALKKQKEKKTSGKKTVQQSTAKKKSTAGTKQTVKKKSATKQQTTTKKKSNAKKKSTIRDTDYWRMDF